MNSIRMRDKTLGSDEKLKADDNDRITNDYMTSIHEEKQPLIKTLSAHYANNLDDYLKEIQKWLIFFIFEKRIIFWTVIA